MEVFMKGRPEYTRERFSGDSSKPPSRDSEELDFNDVFGGPPKRFSMQEVSVRYSFGDSEEDKGASSPWIALKEKPVFGEEISTRRRRQGGDQFFDDIFRADESRSSSHRTDGFIGSSPGSRVMSPVRSFSANKAEPFGTSLPAQFSLPSKSTKLTEFPTSGSPNHSPHKMDATVTNGSNSPHSSSASLSRFSNQPIRGQEEIKNEVLPAYRQSPLSSQVSFSRQGSEKDTKTADSNSNQFHFSIHTWAGKGVPMVMPLVGRNNFRAKDTSRNAPSKNVEPEPLKTGFEKKDLRSIEVSSRENSKARVVLGAARQRIETKQVKTVDEIGVLRKTEKESPSFKTKPLSAWISGEVEQPGNVMEMKENKSRNPKRTQSDAGKNTKKNGGARSDSNRDKLEEYSLQGNVTETKANKSVNVKEKGAHIDSSRENLDEGSLQGAAATAKPSSGNSRVKGKVKDFVSIFNQEADTSPRADFQTRNSSSRWKVLNMDQKQNEVDENPNKDEAQQSTSTKTPFDRNEHSPSDQNTAYSSEPLNRDSKISVENLEDPFEDDYMVQELSDDLEKATPNNEGSQDLKDLDAKIRQWSFGKKGNIRSLLSTLQFVLWEGSGWKPVPLMDLIEANSVKRAYQKALLRLHPDKLQQKGADSRHKFIAEKVFDILQEAWDHFNTLTPL